MEWVLLIIVLVALAILVWYLLIETEGVYLGQRVVTWLYDIYAWRYDDIKEQDDLSEHLQLAQPLMRYAIINDPMVLDVATGTGRIPLALCQHASFEGHIIALEISKSMLKRAIQRIEEERFTDYITFMHGTAEKLPYDDATFDVVTCMEAIEFTPNPQETLAELVRVCRDGGLLLITNRIGVRMPNRIWDKATLHTLLDNLGADILDYHTWHFDYDLVWTRKRGENQHLRTQLPEEIIKCMRCGHHFYRHEHELQCTYCDARIPLKGEMFDIYAHQKAYMKS